MAQTQAQIDAAAVKAQAAAEKATAAAKAAKAAAAKAAKEAKAEAAAKLKAEKAEAAAKLKAEKAEAAAKLKAEKAEKAAAAKAEKEAAKAKALMPVELTGQNVDLTAQVNANQSLIMEAGNSMIMTAMQSGQILTKLKAAVKKADGEWQVWMKANLVLSDRQAQKYMKLGSDPKEVKNLLEEMGEEATINGICAAIGQKGLSNDEIEAREAAKTAKAEAKAAKAKAEAVLDINADEIDDAINNCTNISDLQAMIEFIQARITEILAAPADIDEVEDEGEYDEDDADVIGDLADHIDPVS